MSILWSIAIATATATPAPTALPTLQQQFDAASLAAQTNKCSEAISAFETLERNPKVKPGSLVGNVIALRKGVCQIALRQPGGETTVLQVLPAVRKAGETYTGDVFAALKALGTAELNRSNYAAATRLFEEALPLAIVTERVVVLAHLAEATAFDGGDASLRYADEALRILGADPVPNKESQAALRTIKARTLLNLGRTAEAREELLAALNLSGGLTYKTSLSEVGLRGDLAIVSLLLGKKDDARRYLAYTGQGRIADSPFAVGIGMVPPECGLETGLKPEDFAIVEFAIDEDGAVLTPRTIHTRGGPAVAAAFARAVQAWQWSPEAIKKVPAFYRYSARVELRCTAEAGQGASAIAPLTDRFNAWAETRIRFDRKSAASPAEAAAGLRAILTAKEQQNDLAGQAAAIGWLMDYEPRPSQDLLKLADRGLAAASASRETLQIANTFRIRRTLLAITLDARFRPENAKQIRDLAADPGIASDPLALATVKVVAAHSGRNGQVAAGGEALLQEVTTDPGLEAHHPLRQLALLRLANLHAARGDLAGAQALFDRTGLTEQQCALIGPRPAMKRSGAGMEDFPDEAMRFGFEGWVRLEYDITAEGRAAQPRAIVAYPPFVFVDAAKNMAGGMRFETSYRPGGSLACSADSGMIRFVMGR
jgi:tetratricopeptide (TPR) repeat protein